jgi:serine/threonine protein kinase
MASLRFIKTLDNPGSEAHIVIAMVRETALIPERKIAIKDYNSLATSWSIEMERQMLIKLQGQKGIARLAKCPSAILTGWQLPLEYANYGDFFTFIEKCRDKEHPYPVTKNHIHQIFDQLISAVNSILFLGYVHRDIKPENILVYSFDETHIELGLADFTATVKLNETAEIAGTGQYIPPQIAKKWRHKYTGFEDLYGIGTVLVLFMSYVENKENYPDEMAIANRIRVATPETLQPIINDFNALIKGKITQSDPAIK